MKKLIAAVALLFMAAFVAPQAFAAGSTSEVWRLNVLSTAATHTLNVALYYNSPLTAATCTAYVTDNELATGGGYTAGGKTLTGVSASMSGSAAILSSASVSWASATFTTNGAMLYDASDSNLCIGFLTFTATTKAAATFTLTMPSPIIRLSRHWAPGPRMASCHRDSFVDRTYSSLRFREV